MKTEAKLFQGFTEDPLHLSNGSLHRCFFQPGEVPADVEHFDAVQLIAQGTPNIQYALGAIDSATITGCVFDGEGTPLQCVFGSDGLIHVIEVSDCSFKTSSTHFITLSGLCTGKFYRNTFTDHDGVPIKLYPARIGGNPDGKYNVRVLHFKDNTFNYQPIETDVPELVQDYRQVVFNTRDKFLVNFDKVKFDKLAAQVPKGGGREMGRAFQRIALECGDIVTEYTPETDMQMSDEGLKKLIEEEGFERTVYIDVGADGFETVGVGHKLTRREIGTGIVEIGGVEVPIYFTELTDEQVFQLLRQDIEAREVILSDLLQDVTVSQRQFDALMIFMFNVGRTAFKNSTLLKRLKAGKFDEVPAQMRRWNIFKGKVLPALSNRRERTIAFWNGTDRYEDIASEVLDLPKLELPSPLKPDVQGIEDKAYAAAYNDLERKYKQDKDMEPRVHTNKLDSTTLQGVLGMIVSALFTYAVGKGWMPEGLSTVVQPIALEILGGVAGAFFSKRAWDGRLNAVKTFK